MGEASEDLSADVGDPILLETLGLHALDEVGHAARPAVLHHKPQLVVLAWGRLLDEGPVVGGDVSVVRVLLEHVDLKLYLLLLIQL